MNVPRFLVFVTGVLRHAEVRVRTVASIFLNLKKTGPSRRFAPQGDVGHPSFRAPAGGVESILI